MDRLELANQMQLNFSKLQSIKNKINKYAPSELTIQKSFVLCQLMFIGKSKLKDISSNIEVSTSSLCTMLGHLEKDGLIIREVDDLDRRNTYYSISEKGVEIISREIEKKNEAFLKLLEKLDDADIKRLKNAFEELIDVIGKLV